MLPMQGAQVPSLVRELDPACRNYDPVQPNKYFFFLIGREEVKLSLYADDMILYIENSKDSTQKLLNLINEFSKVVGYKINIQKSVAFCFTNNEMSERECEKTVPFKIAPKKKNT